MEYLGSFVGDEMFEVLLGGNLAVDGDLWLVTVLNGETVTLRADSRRCSSDRKSTGILASLCRF